MRRLAGSLLAVVASVMLAMPLAATGAAARDLTAVERGTLAGAVARFDRAMRTKNIPTIIDVVPPRVTRYMAAQAGVDHRRLRSAVIQQTREIMNGSIIRGFGMDVARARYGATPNGTPYALIPTSTTLAIGGQTVTKTSNTLAMQDGGRWYLLDLNEPSRVSIFTQVYPEFQGVPLGG